MIIIRTILVFILFLFIGIQAAGDASSASLQKQVQTASAVAWKSQKQLQAFQLSNDTAVKALRDSLKVQNNKLTVILQQHEVLKKEFVPAAQLDSLSQEQAKQAHNLRRSMKTISVLLILFVLMASAVTFYVLRKLLQQQLEIEPQNEFQVFFSKIRSALNKQVKAAGEAPPPGGSGQETQMPTQIMDHELPIRVAEEVFRMRVRLSRMPQETKGLSALLNAVSRLEDELNIKGYSLVDLANQPYYDEMTVAVKEFIPQDDLSAGKKKVLRMLKPQVKYLDTIISYGEAEVAISTEDMAQT
jgi:hypothetical protein